VVPPQFTGFFVSSALLTRRSSSLRVIGLTRAVLLFILEFLRHYYQTTSVGVYWGNFQPGFPFLADHNPTYYSWLFIFNYCVNYTKQIEACQPRFLDTKVSICCKKF